MSGKFELQQRWIGAIKGSQYNNTSEFTTKKVINYYNFEYEKYVKVIDGIERPVTNVIADIKNTFYDLTQEQLQFFEDEIYQLAVQSLPKIIASQNDFLKYKSAHSIITVPRAKAKESYHPDGLRFKKAISRAAQEVNSAFDNTDAIIRHTDTITTHLKNSNIINIGELPRPGLIADTCNFDKTAIKGRAIILVDDLYTQGVNIIEDCVQTLYDLGAKVVCVYTIGSKVNR